MKKICIIIPAFNEYESLPNLCNQIRGIDFGEDFNIQTVVVNDCSNDGTKNFVSANTVVLNLSANLGIGGAVQTGLIFAEENGFDMAIQVDGDGQHPPDEISKFLKFITNNPQIDLVIGSRYLTKKGFQSTFMRRFGIKIFSHIIELLTKNKYMDTTSGFRLFNKKALSYFATDYPDEFPEPEVLIIGALIGLNIKEIPVMMKSRDKGTSSITSVKSIYYMTKVILVICYTFMRTKYK